MFTELIECFVIAILLSIVALPLFKRVFRNSWRRIVIVQIIGYGLMITYPRDWCLSLWLQKIVYGCDVHLKYALEPGLFYIVLVIVPAIYAEIVKIERRKISAFMLFAPLVLILIGSGVLVLMKWL